MTWSLQLNKSHDTSIDSSAIYSFQ